MQVRVLPGLLNNNISMPLINKPKKSLVPSNPIPFRKYERKKETVEAVMFNGKNRRRVLRLANCLTKPPENVAGEGYVTIRDSKGRNTVLGIGLWVVKHKTGEISIMSSEFFYKLYVLKD